MAPSRAKSVPPSVTNTTYGGPPAASACWPSHRANDDLLFTSLMVGNEGKCKNSSRISWPFKPNGDTRQIRACSWSTRAANDQHPIAYKSELPPTLLIFAIQWKHLVRCSNSINKDFQASFCAQHVAIKLQDRQRVRFQPARPRPGSWWQLLES